jgi:hypothetical protein
MDIGTWGRAAGFVGIVAAIAEDGELTLFNPGDRQVLRATPGAVQALPAGRVRVAVEVELDVPHGLGEESVRRWVAVLVDPVLRERAVAGMVDAGLDVAAFAPEPVVEVREVADGG